MAVASSCNHLYLSVLLCRQKVLADIYQSNGSPIYGDLVSNTILLFNNQRCNLTYEVRFEPVRLKACSHCLHGCSAQSATEAELPDRHVSLAAEVVLSYSATCVSAIQLNRYCSCECRL